MHIIQDGDMNIDKLKTLITESESESLEFKTSTAKLKSSFETLCAFLNTGGGTVLVGVKDDGRIVGQKVTDQTTLEISNMIAKLEPPAPINIEYIEVEKSKSVIKLTAIPSPSLTPYVFDGKPFWRIGSSTRLMPQQHYQQLLLDKANSSNPWDAKVTNHLAIKDLDKTEIINTLNESIERGRTKAKFTTKDPKTALQTLGLLKNSKLTNAAGILFCKDSETYFPQNLLRLACLKGLTKSEILDSRRIYGNAFALLEETESFLMRHMSISSEFIPGKMARADYPEYSLRAIREAMVNAICHRDYSIEGGSISFMMYNDRIEITSHGTLPRGITLEELKKTHESFPRNSKITHVMYKRGIIESIGTGTQEMLEECRTIGAPEPEYIERGTTFVVQFYKNPQGKQKDDLVLRQKEVLRVMATLGECTTTQILKNMKSPPTDRTLRSDLARLEELGYASRRGEGRATTWKLVK